MLICYAILIVTIWHNVLRFVLGQKRYKSLHITYFYCLTAVVCFLRTFWFCLILTVTIKYEKDPGFYSVDVKKVLALADHIATLTETLLGV